MSNQIIPYLKPQRFYESAVAAIRKAREAGHHKLFLAKIHGVTENRVEPKPKGDWVKDLENEVNACISDNWDVRIIERVEDSGQLKKVIEMAGVVPTSEHYFVKAVKGGEGLPFLNLLITGEINSFLALDDPRYRLVRMGLSIEGKTTTQVLESYWNDLWERCPYIIRRESGLYYGPNGINDLRAKFERAIWNPAFVAMWFGDDGEEETVDFMSKLYEQAFQTAVCSVGYKSERVDFVAHSDFIMNKVLEMIRAAPFVVADFTGNRNGVYFEAGYARAIGNTVIHTCRTKHFAKAHFDIKQINTLTWDEPEDLFKKLVKRLKQELSVDKIKD